MIETLSDLLRPYAFRGKARLLHKLCPREGERETKIFGYDIALDRCDYIQRSIYLGTFEPVESAQIKEYLKEGMTFVDVGANVGYYTLMAASIVGAHGRVVAFEPSPYAFSKLEATIKRNRISQIHAIQAGLADAPGELQLYMPTKKGNHTPSMVLNEAALPITVPVLRLDDYLREHDIDHVELMKIDVEGFEPNVLRGAETYLKRGRISAILCEFNQHWLMKNRSSADALYKTLTGFGFSSSEEPKREAQVQNILFKLAH